MQVLADGLVAGEQAVVRVGAGGLRVVVAGPDVAVATQHAFLATHDHDQLGMRLVADHAVHHVRARLLEAVGELDVRRFVEARHQLDDHGHVLAVACRLDQRLDDRGIRARPVQRLLDREHRGIARRLAQEVHDRREGLERMVQQHVLLADRREQVRRADEATRDAGRERRVLEVRPVDEVAQRGEPVQVHRAAHLVEIGLSELELLEQDVDEVRRAIVRGLEAHRVAVAALRELAFDGAAQVVDLFLVDEQVAVARDAELPAALDLHALEQLADAALHDRRQVAEHERPGVALGARDLHDAGQRPRHLQDREVGVAPERVGALELDDEVQALVLDARERARRIERERREHGFHVLLEVSFEHLVDTAWHAGALQQLDARLDQCRRQHVVEDPVLLADEAACARVDGFQLLADGAPVGAEAGGPALEPLAQARDPDLEELVEVRGADREEADALQQRHRRILGEVEDALVELEEREFAVDVVGRSPEVRLVHVACRWMKNHLSTAVPAAV